MTSVGLPSATFTAVLAGLGVATDPSSPSGFDGGGFVRVLAATALAVVLVLGVTYAIALRVGRHAVIDVAWGLGFTVVALTAFASSAGSGEPLRRWLALLLTSIWGVRLAAHILVRSRGKGEDPRYAALLARARGNPAAYALGHVYVPQALVMWFVSLPVQVAMVTTGGIAWVLWLGVAVWAVGFAFESIGDWQLARFRNDPASTGKVLDTGLWRYTRHPNYFGDACVWIGLFLVAASAWPGVLTALSPLAMTWNLVSGTGKALLEKDISERRPDYADYVRRTSGFVPWPPKPPDSPGRRDHGGT